GHLASVRFRTAGLQSYSMKCVDIFLTLVFGSIAPQTPTLLVQCARVFIQKLEHQSGKLADWVRELLCRKSNFVVTCALANKLARIAWALTARQQTYEA
ncbi:hypothetical protein MTP31_27210, partial [Klebsiella pneumoniae]|nr:hypothetical protein [Klebsiella pneumoniae]